MTFQTVREELYNLFQYRTPKEVVITMKDTGVDCANNRRDALYKTTIYIDKESFEAYDSRQLNFPYVGKQ
jgi:hypothetical protein